MAMGAENGHLSSVLHIDLHVNEKDLFSGALEVLEVVRPEWDRKLVQLKLLTDGVTNKLVGCSVADNTDVVLVRIYGQKTDLFIDRKAETKNIVLLHSVRLAPKLYATFSNGLAYEYIPGCILTIETVREPKIYRLIAAKMAELHKVVNSGPKRPMLWDKLLSFYNLIPEKFTDPEKEYRFRKLIVPKQKLLEEVKELKLRLCDLNSPVVFAHNDLLLANVIHNEKEDYVAFIDFEYAAYNYQAFDIGNHFSEFVGFENIDYVNYPNKEFQILWLREYLSHYNNTNVEDVPSEDLEILYVQVNQFALASHLFWGLWALVQAEHSTIDFDYIDYAFVRLNEYFTRKDSFLALELPR